MEETKELQIGTTVYIIEPKFYSYKIKQGVVYEVPNLESQTYMYMIQFNDAAQTIKSYYRSELHLSKKDAQAIRAQIINNEIQTNQRCIDTYTDIINTLRANTEALNKLLEHKI